MESPEQRAANAAYRAWKEARGEPGVPHHLYDGGKVAPPGTRAPPSPAEARDQRAIALLYDAPSPPRQEVVPESPRWQRVHAAPGAPGWAAIYDADLAGRERQILEENYARLKEDQARRQRKGTR